MHKPKRLLSAFLAAVLLLTSAPLPAFAQDGAEAPREALEAAVEAEADAPVPEADAEPPEENGDAEPPEENGDAEPPEENGDAPATPVSFDIDDAIAYYYEDETLAVEARVTPDSLFAGEGSTLTGFDVFMTGDTDGDDLFSELIETYSGEVRTVELGFCDEHGDAVEQTSGSTLLTLTIPAEGEDAPLKDVELYRCAGDGAIERIEDIQVNEAERTVAFDAGALGSYAVCYTVEFTIGGRVFSLAGYESILLTELLDALDIDAAAERIADVRFSDPRLVSVEPEDGDWRLTTLSPFSTQETLTVTLKDQSAIVITVTDAQHVVDLTKVITDAKLFLDGEELVWTKPLLLRESKYYDLRLTFKENLTYQFVDSDEWMTYPLPDGLDLGLENFERSFTMTVDDSRLSDNLLRYDATLRMFFIRWNTADKLGFNKLKASNSAEFRIDLQIIFTFNPDEIDFGNDIIREVIRDTTSDLAISKVGVYDKDNDRVDYTVSVTSYGVSTDVVVKDVLFGTALRFIDGGEPNHGVTWESDRPGVNDTVRDVTVYRYGDTDNEGDLKWEAENLQKSVTSHRAGEPMGFSLTVGEMLDGETIVFRYSAAVDYDVLVAGTGTGDYAETYNRAIATAGGVTREAECDFKGELRYVELQKQRESVNWGSGDTTEIRWTVRVNNKPKVGLSNTKVRDRIYAGDLESMDYSGDGLHVRVYDVSGVFVGEYDVPWDSPDLTRSALAFSSEKEAAIDLVADWSTKVQAEKLEEELAKDEDEQNKALIAVLQGDRTPYNYAQWEYVIPARQDAVNGDTAVTIDNTRKYCYDFTYTTTADKTLMNFDGYVGNEAQEFKTGSLKQGGLYPPGVGTVPAVEKAVVGSNEDYIYWTISFDRQSYSLTRCVIEDNTPSLYGRRESVDVGSERDEGFYARLREGAATVGGEVTSYGDAVWGTDAYGTVHDPADGEFAVLYVTGLTADERWQITSSSDTRTSFKFYQSPTKPGLLQKGEGRDDTIVIHLRTKNNPEWIQGTMTKYWPRDHVNTVTWVANAHEVRAEATETPDIRKIEKIGKQIGSVVNEDGVSLPVFRFELYLTGISDDDFYVDPADHAAGTKNLVVYDSFNTRYLAFVDVKGNADVAGKKTFTPDELAELEVLTTWDQALKGYSKSNGWVGPTAAAVSDYRSDGETAGIAFTVTQEDFVKKGYEPGEPGVYCLRYSLPYYLMVKDSAAARDLAAKSNAQLAAEGITKLDDMVTFGNTATWAGVTVPAEADAEASFKPMSKTLVYDHSTDTCTYTLVINPQRLRLNDGNPYKIEDRYENLAVDFSTVSTGLTAYPAENRDKVNWAYHNNVGTFWIPDETAVTITYQAKPIGEPGKSVSFSNTMTMLNYAPEIVDRTVTLNNESEGSAGDYNIRLFKYADNAMNLPLEGAVFQLLEESPSGEKTPVTYQTTVDADTPDNPIPRYSTAAFNDYELLSSMTPTAPTNRNGATAERYPTREVHEVGDYIYFCTTKSGYANIHLNMSLDGVALDRGKQYYLREIVTPDGYSKENIDWSFIIDDMDFFDSENGIYVYRDNGELTVSNTSHDSGLVLRKDILGAVPAWEDQKQIAFDITVRETDSGSVVLAKTVTYGDFTQDNSADKSASGYRFKLRPNELNVTTDKSYSISVTERAPALNTHDCAVTVETQVGAAARSGRLGAASASVTVSGAELLDGNSPKPVRFWFENTYTAKPVSLTVTKAWGEKASAKLDKSATFALSRTGADGTTVELERFTLSEENGWTQAFFGLDRYDADGNAYAYSAKEVGASYRDGAGGALQTTECDDFDWPFTVGAADPDQSGKAVFMKSPTEAEFDLDRRTGAALTFTNEIATLIDITVKKEWPEGEEAPVTFDLYRTTEELPVGGKERRTFNIEKYYDYNSATGVMNSGAYVNLTSYSPTQLEIADGDEIELTLYIDKNYDYSASANWKNRFLSLNGLQGRIQSKALFDTLEAEFREKNPSAKAGHSQLYAFDPVHLYVNNGDHDYINDTYLDGQTYKNHLNLNTVTEKGFTMPGSVLTSLDDYVRFVVRADHLDDLGGDYTGGHPASENIHYDASETLFIRGPYQRETIISIRNLTAESENISREKLEDELVMQNRATLVRSDLSMEDVENLSLSMRFPREDVNGRPYTYFVLESPVPSGYEDSYGVEIAQDEDDPAQDTREHTITITNAKIGLAEGETTELIITKNEVFAPEAAAPAERKTAYYVTLSSGSKYVVRNSAGTYEPELKSPAQINAHNSSPENADSPWTQYLRIDMTGGTGSLVIGNIPTGSYVIREADDAAHEADYDGFTRFTEYSNQTLKLEANRSVSRTVTNTFRPIPAPGTTFRFYKLWTTESDSQPVEWSTDQEISLTFRREAGGVEDAGFRVTFTVRYTYNAAEDRKEWVIERDADATGDVNSDESLYLTPVLSATGDPGRYFKYAFTLSGVAVQDENGAPYVYYVTENVPDGAELPRYGVVSGTAAVAVSGMERAEDGKAIINTFEQAELTFIKQWYGQDRAHILTEWPTREVEVDPESDAGAVPTDVPETKPVPISVRIGRRLEYTDGTETVLSKDLDVTFDARFNNLTGESAYLESHTAEGKLTLQMTNDNGSFRFTVKGLKKSGAMTVNGEVKTGAWRYYVFEDYVYGYHTSYYEYTGTPEAPWRILDDAKGIGGVSAPSGGKIVNTQQLGTLLINKNVVIPANTTLGEKTYSFVVRRKRAEGAKGLDRYLLTDGTLTTEYTVHTVTVTDDSLTGNWLYFYDVIPGDYLIEELGTEASGAAQRPGYTLTVSPTAENEDGTCSAVQVKTLEGNNKIPAEFTNTYEIIKTKKAFQKVWLNGAGGTPIEWPDGETITIELRRYVEGTAIEDESFQMVYTGRKQDGGIVWTAVKDDSKSLETDEDQVILTEVVNGYVYNITFDRLTQYVLTGENAGSEWVYYIKERAQDRTDFAVHYGEVSGGTATVNPAVAYAHGNAFIKAATGEGENAGTTETIDAVYQSAVINRRDYAHARITKVWLDENGEIISWPKDGGGTDIPIVITATGTKAGAGNDVRTYILTTADPSDGDQYTLSVSENRYTFTLYRLKPDYTYTFTEGDVLEYLKTYRNETGETVSEAFPENGTVVNKHTPTGTVAVNLTKVWEPGYWPTTGASAEKVLNGNTFMRLYKVVTVNDPDKIQINVTPRGYDAAGNRVASGGNSVVWSYIYLYDENGTQLGSRIGFSLTFAADAGQDMVITDKIRNGKEVKFVRLEIPSLNNSNYAETGTIWLPSATGFYSIDHVLNIPVDLTITAAASIRRSSGYDWYYPKDAYAGLPDNAVPTKYGRSRWNYGSNFGNAEAANNGWLYWDNSLRANVSTTELPAYENGCPVTYYVVEEYVNTQTNYAKLEAQGVTVSYSKAVGTNNWTITNSRTYTETTFSKEWYAATGVPLDWPKDSSDNALPITVQVSRRLKYLIDGETKYTADQDAGAFSLTYAVTPSGGRLTRVNGRDASDAERTQYPLTPDSDAGSGYAFRIAGLETKGSLGSRSGEWDYRVTETSRPVGFAEPEYCDAAGVKLANGGMQIQKGGTIRNRQLPVTRRMSVTKRFDNGVGHWPEGGFLFTLAQPTPSAGVVLPAVTTVAVKESTPRLEGVFDAVTFKAAGEYSFTITEASAENPYILCDAEAHSVSVSVTEVNGALVAGAPVYDVDSPSLTVVNTYNGPVSFSFSKVWLDADAVLPASDFRPWPAGETITVTLRRRADGVEDGAFALVYELGADGAAFQSADSSGYDPAKSYDLSFDGADNWYFFSTGMVLDRADGAGRSYAYYLEETSGVAGYEKSVGKLNVDDQVTAVFGDEATDGQVLVNRDTRLEIQVAKRWQDAQGTPESVWPAGRQIALTVTGSRAGSADEVYSFAPVGAGGSAAANGATLSVSDGYPFTVTVSGLPYGSGSALWTYAVTEAAVDGYEPPTYANEPPNDTLFTHALDGGTITNRRSPAKQTVRVTKAVKDERDAAVADGLWPSEGFSFTLSYVGYTDGADAFSYAVNGYNDASLRPLVRLPASVTETATAADKTAVFDEVTFYRAGEYTFRVTENLPADALRGVAHGIRYDTAPRTVTVSVTENMVAAAPVYEGGGTVTNTRLEKTDFCFSKVWRSEDSDVVGNQPWPNGQSIEVVIERYVSNVKDDGFALTYTIGKNDAAVSPDGAPTLTRVSAAGNVYRYRIGEVLPRWDENGNEYSYRARESKLTGCVTSYLDRFGDARSDDATDEGAIVNTASITTATCSLTIRKTVSGNMGDRQKSFAFMFDIDQEGSFAISGAGYAEGAVIASGGTFRLAHGQSVTISGIPTSAVIILTENCESYSASWSLDGVTQTGNVAESVCENVRCSALTLNLSSVALPDGDTPLELSVNNDLNIAINTGASFNAAPFATVLLLLSAALWLAFKRRFDDAIDD